MPSCRSVWWVGTGVTLAFAASATVRAEVGPEETVQEPSAVIYVYGTRERYRESETSSATRTPTPLEELPQSVFVITRDIIEDQAMTGLGDLFRYVPGVTMGQGKVIGMHLSFAAI